MGRRPPPSPPLNALLHISIIISIMMVCIKWAGRGCGILVLLVSNSHEWEHGKIIGVWKKSKQIGHLSSLSTSCIKSESKREIHGQIINTKTMQPSLLGKKNFTFIGDAFQSDGSDTITFLSKAFLSIDIVSHC